MHIYPGDVQNLYQLVKKATGGIVATILSLAIDRLFPFSELTIRCGPTVLQLSAVLTILSGIFITTLLVDWDGVTINSDNHLCQ